MTIPNKSEKTTELKKKPTITTCDQHTISHAAISKNALKVLHSLKGAGYKAYLVGGSVRDILLDRKPKDFDVVTDARPEQIRKLFRHCRLIGRRFRLAHVRFGTELIEVSTFRAPHHVSDRQTGRIEEGRIIRDNVYGDIDDDVWRRDFTINALFYNIEDCSIVDYVGGVEDLKTGQLRLIGDPAQRYIEDPVRMIRAVRFSAKLGLKIHPAAEQPIGTHATLLKDIPAGRLFEEMLKLFQGGCAQQTFALLRYYDLFKYLFPQTDNVLNTSEHDYPHTFIMQALKNTDQRINAGHSVAPGFLVAVLLWEPMRIIADGYIADGLSAIEAVRLAGAAVIARQIASTTMPRRHTHMAHDIWLLQVRLQRTKKRTMRILAHPKFRAAYDFLLLRAEAGEPLPSEPLPGEALQELIDYWTQAQSAKYFLDADKTRSNARKPHARRRPRTNNNVADP